MKTTQSLLHWLTRVTLVTGLTGLTWLSFDALAQEKGAEFLVRLHRQGATAAAVQRSQADDAVARSCLECKDTWITVAEKTGKAANPTETKLVLRHGCPGCETRFVTEGPGKHAKTWARHRCRQSGSEKAACCIVGTPSSSKTAVSRPAVQPH